MLSPMVKATLQAAALSAVSNLLAQLIAAYRTNQSFSLNVVELARFIILTLISAPPNYKWQQLLEKTFPAYENGDSLSSSKSPLSSSLPMTRRDAVGREKKYEPDPGTNSGGGKPKLNLKNTFYKWFIDCITIGTLLNTMAFFIIMGALKGQSLEQIQKMVAKETFPLIRTGYRVWPIVSIISFSFVPVERRIVFGSIIGTIWGIYMSFLAANV